MVSEIPDSCGGSRTGHGTMEALRTLYGITYSGIVVEGPHCGGQEKSQAAKHSRIKGFRQGQLAFVNFSPCQNRQAAKWEIPVVLLGNSLPQDGGK